MDDNIIDFIKSCVEGAGYKIISVIQHGSTVMRVSEGNSDTDYMVVVETPVKKEHTEMPVIANKSKIHLSLMQKECFTIMLIHFYSDLAKRILDVNMVAGRVIQGELVYDESRFAADLMENNKLMQCPDFIVEKFAWQCFGFITDAKHSHPYIKQNCVEKAVDSWGIAVLLLHSILTLNLKWQPILLERCLEPELYDCYIQLRFNYCKYNQDEINWLLKRLVDYIRSEIHAYKSGAAIH